MKINAADCAELKVFFQKYLLAIRDIVEAYTYCEGMPCEYSDAAYLKKLRADYTAKGLSETRYLWDMYWIAYKLSGNESRVWALRVYDYCNDEHITTALRAVVKELSEPV